MLTISPCSFGPLLSDPSLFKCLEFDCKDVMIGNVSNMGSVGRGAGGIKKQARDRLLKEWHVVGLLSRNENIAPS